MATVLAAKGGKTVTAGGARAQVNQMLSFTWVGTDKRGAKLKGDQLGKSVTMVKAELRRQGINPTSVKPKSKPLFGAAGKRVTAREVAVFSRQLATMMSSGIPMVQAFEIVASGQDNPRMKNMLVDIKENIEGGSSLAESLGKYPIQFDDLFRNLVSAGEAAGVLDTVLETVATYKENLETLKGKIKKALFYPAIVLSVAVIVSAVLLIFVVPTFQAVFKQAGSDLPAFTLMLVSASDFLVADWWLVLIIVVGSIVGLVMMKKRSQRFAHFLDRLMLKLPIIGKILHQSAIARFARTLGVTFRAGVPLVEALDAVGGATGSVVYADATKRIREDVAVGHSLQLSMRQANLFPSMVVQMIAIGEESGALDKMLFKIAEFYEQEVNNAVDTLSTLLEPMIMMIIGVVVGGIVVGMYLPIFKLASTM